MAGNLGSKATRAAGSPGGKKRRVGASKGGRVAPTPARQSSGPEFLSGGGEMGALMRAKRWEETPLGPPASWPESLRTTVRILMTSRYQMWMGWGKELTFLYNDAYRPTLGIKHGWALGSPAREVWKEIWSDVGPRIEQVLTSGLATWDESLLLLLERSGYPEETYHTFSYSPLADDEGRVVGMLCVVTEETERIIGERRLGSLNDLASGITGMKTTTEVLGGIEEQLNANLKDIPFSLTYLFNEDGTAELASLTGVGRGHAIAPDRIETSETEGTWPASDVRDGRSVLVIDDLDRRFAAVPAGAWQKPPREAVVAPIMRQGLDAPAGFFVSGVNPYRRLDSSYLGFIGLVAGQIASGLANVHAYQEERRRADALAEIDRAKTTFFSNVSHEFRTPLTLMLGPLEDVLARDDGSPLAEHRSLVQVAHRSGIRLLKLVNTLLDFSRIEAGRALAQIEAADLSAFTVELASNFRPILERAGLQLIVRAPPLPWPVSLDREMWEKIVFNLLSNAFKFTFEGEIVIEIKPSADGQFAIVELSDTGTGIPEHELPHVFERFRRIANARGRSIEGSGIGLALVQELVKAQGGSISVVSRVGQGTRFCVTMPFSFTDAEASGRPDGEIRSGARRAQAYIDEALGWLTQTGGEIEELAPPSASEEADLAANSTQTAGAGPVIVLADDNADMRNYLSRLLRSANYRVEAVSDGEQALQLARRIHPDLVLTDVMMPSLDGFGLLAALRADVRLQDTPILMLSARAGEESKFEGLSAGANDYLTKPFNARELLARVRSTLDTAARRRDAVLVENELRRQAEMAQERAEAILASISDGFYALDHEWRFTYMNAAAARLIGVSGENLIGHVYWDCFPMSKGGPVETHFHRAMSERQSCDFEFLSRSWGRWFSVRVFPARDGGLAVYFQDITERKRAEDELKRMNETLEAQVAERTSELRTKEARLRAIFETSFIFQGLTTVEGTLLDANATSLASIGSKLEEVVNKPFWEAPWFTATPDMRERVREAIPQAAKGVPMREEICLNLPIGGWRWFDFQIRPVRDAEGVITAIVPEAVEVSERRHAEERLRQAQKMESIGQLTGGVAHDFNNLLTIVIGNLETLHRRLAKEPIDVVQIRRLADNSMVGAERAAALTRRLLAFARRQPLNPDSVDIGRLIAGMKDLLRRAVDESVQLRTHLADPMWRANVDANQLEVAILNLAINARDAMTAGGLLTIETSNLVVDAKGLRDHPDATPGHYVRIAIRDTGVGMSAETLARAFEPFFTTKDVGHGTGLGLSQVYGFVTQSGGHVRIESALGRGTTVEILLPRSEGDALPSVAPAAAPTVARAREHEAILVVEDNDEVRAHTVSALRELGYDVIEAARGSTALARLDERPDVKLLFTDIGLPGGMSGAELAEAARRERPDLKVLFATGYARDTVTQDPRILPTGLLVAKPFAFVALATKIREILDGIGGGRGAA